MSAADFSAWATPDLRLPLRGRTFVVRPPSVEGAKKVLALAALGEVNLGFVPGPLPDEVQEVLDTIGPDEHPALGDAYGALSLADVDPWTIDKMAYYAIFYWARGKAYADAIARLLWEPATGTAADVEADEPAPKAQPTSLQPNGLSTGSANPSTTTRTASPSTPTTDRPEHR